MGKDDTSTSMALLPAGSPENPSKPAQPDKVEIDEA
jgi:hypothetical protein